MTRTIDVLVAIILLLILSVALIFASLVNIKSTAVETREFTKGSFNKISRALGISYTPYTLEGIDTDIVYSSNISYSDQDGSGSLYSLARNTCRRDERSVSNCPIPKPNIRQDNQEDLPRYSKRCLLKDEYSRICKYTY